MTSFPDIPRITREWCEMRPVGGFNLLMVDPPWRFKTYSDRGRGRSADAHYTCRSLDWIKALPVADALAAEHAVLWLWATAPMIREAIDIIDAWGFAYSTMGFWSKRGASGKLAFGTGYRLRCAGEPFLIGTRGKPRTARSVRSVIEGPRRAHSQKPDEAFAAAEALMPNARRIEVFSRQRRPGWATWGDEIDRFTPAEDAADA